MTDSLSNGVSSCDEWIPVTTSFKIPNVPSINQKWIDLFKSKLVLETINKDLEFIKAEIERVMPDFDDNNENSAEE